MSAVYDLAEAYVERFAALDPLAATMAGIPGHESETSDYSPDGIAARAEHDRATLAALATLPREGERDRIAAEALAERLRVWLELSEAGERLRELRPIFSPVQRVRQVYDLMARSTVEDWEAIAARMAAVPDALAGFQASLAEGVRRGLVASRRQALACAEQARVWSGMRPDTPSFFSTLVDAYDRAGGEQAGGEQAGGGAALRRRLEEGAAAAAAGYARLAAFLTDTYAPRAAERDPVGAERYARWARAFTGLDLDLAATYAWGWEEVHRIEEQTTAVGDRILPGAPLPKVIELLESDPGRAIDGVEPFRRFLQDLMDATIDELDGRHFDIPAPVRRIEAMIAPPGGAAAMYYTGPSEDFRRPGRTWYPTLGRTAFPLWREVSTAYHEGVPGHHLQVAQVRYLAGQLSRFQRTLGFVSGHGEGWALYAERLMGELGYLDNPDYELGMLDQQLFRAMRIVVDIGLHLELPIPGGEGFGPGAIWTPERALAFLVDRGGMPEPFVRSEVDRYLGWPGQAISYKVGEREWLAARSDARRVAGAAFDLKAFHTRALGVGPMGLAQLRRTLGASPAPDGAPPNAVGAAPAPDPDGARPDSARPGDARPDGGRPG